MRNRFLPRLALALCALLLLSILPASAKSKLPIIDINKGLQINNAREIIAFTRLQSNFLVAGVDEKEQSWVSLVDEKGSEIWRNFPIVTGVGGDGFITAIGVSGNGIVISGLSQEQLTIQTVGDAPSPSVTPTSAAATTATPTTAPAPTTSMSASPAASSSVPLANPDNVAPTVDRPFRKDLENIFVARLDNSGNLVSVINTKNDAGFIPESIATRGTNTFVVGNLAPGENKSRGALYKFSDSEFLASFTYGQVQTRFTKVLASSTKNLTVVGSSSDTLAQRKVVGRADGVILTISQETGALTKVLRSSGAGAIRSWDFASGNLLLSGTARVGSSREGVVTSFNPKGAVLWTTRFPQTNKALALNNCIALSGTNSEVLIYLVDSKGKQIRGARLPKQELIALAPTAAKGCAVVTSAPGSGFRVSYL